MKKILLIAVFAPAALLTVLGLVVLYNLPLDRGERSPEQPIAFSHRLHSGGYEIACLYCHRNAERGRHAGIPDIKTCQACHQFIASDRPEIQKVLGYWERREPIPWVRVHDLPDHVYFPHRMHLRAGVDCRHCHGEVAAMERLTRVVSLKMGWCLGCHRDNQASIDCWTCHI